MAKELHHFITSGQKHRSSSVSRVFFSRKCYYSKATIMKTKLFLSFSVLVALCGIVGQSATDAFTVVKRAANSVEEVDEFFRIPKMKDTYFNIVEPELKKLAKEKIVEWLDVKPGAETDLVDRGIQKASEEIKKIIDEKGNSRTVALACDKVMGHVHPLELFTIANAGLRLIDPFKIAQVAETFLTPQLFKFVKYWIDEAMRILNPSDVIAAVEKWMNEYDAKKAYTLIVKMAKDQGFKNIVKYYDEFLTLERVKKIEKVMDSLASQLNKRFDAESKNLPASRGPLSNILFAILKWHKEHYKQIGKVIYGPSYAAVEARG